LNILEEPGKKMGKTWEKHGMVELLKTVFMHFLSFIVTQNLGKTWYG
jgi:hypothetical protein